LLDLRLILEEAYSFICHRVKIDLLKISDELNEFSVVSAEASAMALSVKQIMKSDYAIYWKRRPFKGDSNAQVGLHINATPSSLIVEEFNFGQPVRK
jgi:hypothetical protein